jgi:hypothetical protein
MRFFTQYELMIHDFYGNKSKLFQHILSPLISYQICTRLLNKKKLYYGNNSIYGKEMERKRESMDAITYVRSTKNKYYPSN